MPPFHSPQQTVTLWGCIGFSTTARGFFGAPDATDERTVWATHFLNTFLLFHKAFQEQIDSYPKIYNAEFSGNIFNRKELSKIPDDLKRNHQMVHSISSSIKDLA